MFLFQPHQVIYLDLKSLLYYNYCLKINIHNISGLTKGFVSVKISSRLYIQRCKYTHSLLASVCTFVSKVKLLFCDKKKTFKNLDIFITVSLSPFFQGNTQSIKSISYTEFGGSSKIKGFCLYIPCFYKESFSRASVYHVIGKQKAEKDPTFPQATVLCFPLSMVFMCMIAGLLQEGGR